MDLNVSQALFNLRRYTDLSKSCYVSAKDSNVGSLNRVFMKQV